MTLYVIFKKAVFVKSLSIRRTEERREIAEAELNSRLFFRFLQSANTLQKQGTKALHEYGITTHQGSVLGALSRPQSDQGMSVKELSDYLMMSRQNLTGILNRLDHLGLIHRLRDENDGRTKRVGLTTLGLEKWMALEPLLDQFYLKALQGFSFDVKIDFLAQVNRLLGNMKKT